MPVFGLGRKKTGIGAKPRMVPGDGDPVAEALIAAAVRRDLAAVRATLGQYEGGALSILLSNLAKNSVGAYSWLGAEPELSEKNALDRLLLGSVAVNHAWRIRTAAGAQHVSRDKFRRFHEKLREAEEHLYAVVELEPSWAAPWSLLLTSGRGLEVGVEINTRRFEAAAARCPDHRIAHQQMLQQLCAKWSGSHEQMHAFAAEAARGPHWSALAHLVAIGHIEHWLALEAGAERTAYIKGPKVREELEEAADLSLFGPGEPDPRSPYFEANLFAMAFSLAGMYGEAERAFERTDGVVTRFPWEYGNSRDPVTLFTLRRAKARSSRG